MRVYFTHFFIYIKKATTTTLVGNFLPVSIRLWARKSQVVNKSKMLQYIQLLVHVCVCLIFFNNKVI